ncbi:MFS transporter [Sedimentisphaera salicampi]|uniref:Oxalate/formate antiporter family transporter n=1 Tax=Sedimentisphaera salicampi TaxID=1941349 RepID=A0A1W6LJV6_9BACT|nr:MFS transporter [Sedimentisphaera salicampi]ARN56049.1 oxalate/formate antiporter family transporter [Sedimentisphaera salicampi]OXU15782.1 oxalate/formate antiporter family transporter [Sedimentisphaera salicampi]
MSTKLVNFPFKPAKIPFFYGWVIVAVCAIGVVMSVPGQTIGFSVFTEPLREAVGLSRKDLSKAYLVGTLLSSFMLPFAGKMIDKLGGRIMGTISAFLLGLACLLMSQIDRFAEFAGQFGLAFAAVCLCFTFMRFSGQGCMTMSSRVTMARWFEHRRGLTAALSGIVVSFGFNASPKPLGLMVGNIGWSSTYIALSAAVGIGMSIIAFVMFRDNPEDCGMHVDGPNYQKAREKSGEVADEYFDFTRSQAVKTVEFWIYTFAVALSALLTTSISFHTEAIGMEAGLTAQQAFGLYMPMSFFSAFSNLLGGYFSDKVKMKKILFIFMIAITFAIIGTANWDKLYGRVMFMAGFGTSGGLFNTLRTVAWARFFGRKHLGAINGLTMSMLVISTAAGPWLFSLLKGFFGTYSNVLLSFTVFPIIIFISAFFTGNPQERYAENARK